MGALDRQLKMDDTLFECFNQVEDKEALLGQTTVTIEDFKAKKISRPACMKLIWGYIKQKGLQDEANKKEIKLDDTLKAIFGGEDKISMFKLAGGINQHLSAV